MNQKINLAIQVLPTSKDVHPYKIVDSAIELIQASGLKYQVCPFETVIEGEYDALMALVKKVQFKCYEAGADSLIVNMKVQSSGSGVSIDDKMHKYQNK